MALFLIFLFRPIRVDTVKGTVKTPTGRNLIAVCFLLYRFLGTLNRIPHGATV
jgi:hypothetical protein